MASQGAYPGRAPFGYCNNESKGAWRQFNTRKIHAGPQRLWNLLVDSKNRLSGLSTIGLSGRRPGMICEPPEIPNRAPRASDTPEG
jgi:hypothetical protein